MKLSPTASLLLYFWTNPNTQRFQASKFGIPENWTRLQHNRAYSSITPAKFGSADCFFFTFLFCFFFNKAAALSVSSDRTVSPPLPPLLCPSSDQQAIWLFKLKILWRHLPVCSSRSKRASCLFLLQLRGGIASFGLQAGAGHKVAFFRNQCVWPKTFSSVNYRPCASHRLHGTSAKGHNVPRENRSVAASWGRCCSEKQSTNAF